MHEKEGYLFTSPKRVTSPTWGPPPPCKQALNCCRDLTHIICFHVQDVFKMFILGQTRLCFCYHFQQRCYEQKRTVRSFTRIIFICLFQLLKNEGILTSARTTSFNNSCWYLSQRCHFNPCNHLPL